MPVLLVVDDEPAIQHAFQRAFRGGDVELRAAGSASEALASITQSRPDVVVLDIHLPDATGLAAFHQIHAIDPRIPIILVTGHGTTDLAIEALKEGAYEYLLKPLELAELRQMIGQALHSSRLMRQPAVIPDADAALPLNGDLLLGRCPAMQEVYKSIGRVARQNVTVLVTGESGTGKELVARAIYQHSNRSGQPFLAINCAAIPETLLESELFGHEKGAFTSADRQRIGKFEQCHGGTIFLDEVGDMTSLTQSKILRLIQEQRFERIGGNTTISTDVRILAATNADLESLVEEGRFRRDLYFRLNVFTIKLPPLRDRGEDVLLLVDHFVHKFSGELNKRVAEVSAEAYAALRNYSWPGNIRELQSVLKRAILQMSGSVLLVDFLPEQLRSRPLTEVAAAGDWEQFVGSRIATGSEHLYAEALERMEREVILRVLRHTNGNQLQAARILGITRGSLRNKVRSLGISIARSVWSDDDHADT